MTEGVGAIEQASELFRRAGGTRELTEVDDLLHEPGGTDREWTETVWYGFAVPERAIGGCVYTFFRTNIDICSSGVYVWDTGGETLQDLLHASFQWYLPVPAGDLDQLTVGDVTYTCVEPMKRHRLTYVADDLAFALDFEGIHRPFATVVGSSGHFDQICAVTGSLRLVDEELEVNCFEMRDRSWSVRSDHREVRGTYSYATTNAEDAMLVSAGADGAVARGFRLRDGVVSRVVAGHRSVERVNGRPEQIRIEATDELGHQTIAEGTAISRFGFQCLPKMFSWMSQVRWTLDGQLAFGEDQDGWSLDNLRAARRAGW